MCYALDAIIKDAEEKGKRQGTKQGIQQGVKQGMQQGVRQGIDRTNRLIQLLLADGRQRDLEKSVTDPRFQKKLFQEYRI
ncbi:MAG: hypothetical protein HFH87_17800 [Lachnospiraceae bacterium]|nr:hypothetical protein [Lachnospiraceae bacterium]